MGGERLMDREPRKPAYDTDLTDPDTRRAYEAYKRQHGIPAWCPLSEDERREFDMIYNHRKRKTPADGWQADQQGHSGKEK